VTENKNKASQNVGAQHASEQRTGRGRPRDETKNIAIIEAASFLFMDSGFDGVSMDAVARQAGVSKQTVYSHFSSKEQLFSASIRTVLEKYYPEIALEQLESHSLEGDLRAVCESYARLLLSEDAFAMNRVLVAASSLGGKSSLAGLFWESGPSEMDSKLCAFLQAWVDKGELVIDDLDTASSQLLSLLRGRPYFMRSIGLIPEITEELFQHTVDTTVNTFLKLYRA